MAEIKDPENTILIELKDGTVAIELLPDVAPGHTARMKELARSGAYDNGRGRRLSLREASKDLLGIGRLSFRPACRRDGSDPTVGRHRQWSRPSGLKLCQTLFVLNNLRGVFPHDFLKLCHCLCFFNNALL